MGAPGRSSRATKRASPSLERPLEIDWTEAVERFLQEGRRTNLSVATLQNYRSYLAGPRVMTFLADHRLSGPREMTGANLKAFENEIIGVALSSGTVATYHRVLKNFLGFCIREGFGPASEVLELPGPRVTQEEPESFSEAEERRLLAVLKDRPRDEMLVRFLLRTGLRLSEASAVNLDDIVDSSEGSYVRVRQGKGRKDRIVPLDSPSDNLSARLRRYVAQFRPRDTDDQALFLSSRKHRGRYQRLTPSGIQVLCQRLSEETGIHVNPHKFRHTFATRSLSAGVDVMALQKALGHTTLSMVSRYVHYQKEDLLQAWKARRD